MYYAMRWNLYTSYRRQLPLIVEDFQWLNTIFCSFPCLLCNKPLRNCTFIRLGSITKFQCVCPLNYHCNSLSRAPFAKARHYHLFLVWMPIFFFGTYPQESPWCEGLLREALHTRPIPRKRSPSWQWKWARTNHHFPTTWSLLDPTVDVLLSIWAQTPSWVA